MVQDLTEQQLRVRARPTLPRPAAPERTPPERGCFRLGRVTHGAVYAVPHISDGMTVGAPAPSRRGRQTVATP
ncbi:hypothetical protein ACWC2T_15230 [Streptomyces sp. NPDC001393]